MAGLFFPFEEDPATGDLRRASGLDSIRSNVRGIASMGVVEVSGFEGSGAGLRRVLFGDPNKLSAVAANLRDAVVAGETRVQVLDTKVDMLSAKTGRVVLRYKPRNTATIDELAFQET